MWDPPEEDFLYVTPFFIANLKKSFVVRALRSVLAIFFPDIKTDVAPFMNVSGDERTFPGHFQALSVKKMVKDRNRLIFVD